MAKAKKNNESDAPNSFRFNLTGLILFSLCLIAGAAFVTGKFFNRDTKQYSFAENVFPNTDTDDKSIYTRVGPWGELLVRNIQLERPMEYITSEISTVQPEVWTFDGMNVEQVKSFFLSHGVSAAQTEKILSSTNVSVQETGTVLTPDEDFIFSLSPETRQKFYVAMYGMGVNFYLDYPYIFSKENLDSIYSDPRLNPDDVAFLKKLVYPNGEAMHLSDYAMLMAKIPTPERRAAISRALSRQSAALVGLCIRPDTDIDKMAGYWSHMDNVRFTDVRPLLESLKNLPHGGSISIVYFLPPFARDRLYTYPVPQPDDPPVMDCQWTTFNFSNLKPDNRFNDPNYLLQYIKDNYYQINAPSVYGDVVLLMNDKQEFKHSAVYLADDLYFTKFGNNYTQPWMITRMADMQAVYPTLKPVFFRKKTD